VTVNGYGVSFLGDENVLELGGAIGCTTLIPLILCFMACGLS
jgi:hypothetical protein